MSTHTGRIRPALIPALVKIAMISTWRGRTFLDDNQELEDIVGFVPDEPAQPLQLPITTVTSSPQVESPVAVPGHSVAA